MPLRVGVIRISTVIGKAILQRQQDSKNVLHNSLSGEEYA